MSTAAANTPQNTTKSTSREQMDIVVIGHVDHGKSTVVGRLLADTGSLPEGKLQSIREQCQRNARPFEYAFLLDALKDEQAQGITIDAARCFFRTKKREYIIIDAPGHIEFLKNMISGAARAEAGLLVIDAKEGVQENSRRHGYLMSLLGIRQIAVLVNKMDLVDYRQDVFESVRDEYTRFLADVGLEPLAVLPVSAREGDNLATPGDRMPWHHGPTVLQVLDSMTKEPPPIAKPLRMPVQDIYKFTEADDDRRIVAGRIDTGSLNVGDAVVFLPSGKQSRVKSIEAFSAPARTSAAAGESIGVTLDTQIYIRPGELMVRADQPAPSASTRLRANLFWLSPNPMIPGKRYKMKLHNARAAAYLTEIHRVIDASSLSHTGTFRQVERHDVAEVTIETLKPVACDSAADIPQTGRFVIIDNYEIVGGGVILLAEQATNTLIEEHVRQRNQAWLRSTLTPERRASRHHQRPALVVLTGQRDAEIEELGRAMEAYLHNSGRLVYFLGVSNQLLGLDADLKILGGREEYLRRLGEIAHLFTDAGQILITSIANLEDYELDMIDALNKPGELVVVNIGENRFSRRRPDLLLDTVELRSLQAVHDLLQQRNYIQDYQI